MKEKQKLRVWKENGKVHTSTELYAKLAGALREKEARGAPSEKKRESSGDSRISTEKDTTGAVVAVSIEGHPKGKWYHDYRDGLLTSEIWSGKLLNKWLDNSVMAMNVAMENTLLNGKIEKIDGFKVYTSPAIPKDTVIIRTKPKL